MNRVHANCPSCICGKRAHVQGDRKDRRGKPGEGPGTISWAEHELAWSAYAARYGRDESAERIHERGGFCFLELIEFLGHEPETWVPAGAVAERER